MRLLFRQQGSPSRSRAQRSRVELEGIARLGLANLGAVIKHAQGPHVGRLVDGYTFR
jgi:hypothetical protein